MKTFVVGDIHGRCAQLQGLLEMLPRDESSDTLVFLGDLIDRGADVPGCVDFVSGLCRENPERVICLLGNHEQMLLDFVDDVANLWLTPVIGSEHTFAQYTGQPLRVGAEEDFERARELISRSVPAEHLEFFRNRPLYHEDDYALYVHAGLEENKHPRDSSSQALLWSRDANFYKHYSGKPCVFGHTPTTFLPWRGRLGRHGIYLFKSAIGIDTGYNLQSPLSCLSLPDFTLYQTFADGHQATHHITSFIPETMKAMQSQNRLR
ncbi:MAG: serine/threonine protein phosphatase 1 [Blastocatellia bacterium]|jgi:serine/threonine protein phosphatase 1|nr:serine/threonine protein phosphatase 1 [Blastocatellia bacterium]